MSGRVRWRKRGSHHAARPRIAITAGTSVIAALTALGRSEDRMRQFVADASHELRTPLQSLRGYAELYRSGALPDRASVDEAVERMLSEIHRMTRLVESLLMLARFDVEDEAELEPVDLSRLVRDACRDAAAVEPDRPVEVRVEEGVTVLGDEAQLRSLLGNLLGNVRMHTPPDAPCAVSLRTSGGDEVLHHGLISLDSAPGRGTRVDVVLRTLQEQGMPRGRSGQASSRSPSPGRR
ncbi:cell wall metabolism sensor histidine kinase WalK [Streptomyces sp. AS02]|uniref:sensor histidine kinase n=1 Tax=Streptomyces sp. AS02 TaxID=2938946 RepID=UPI002020FBEE|nr:HAMP domain-containing histidine kinase [Streptomyces sp. AS02]MCL8014899.1 HAMP domain-containing histidine kinase [Streptomyces sp. AS02]